MKSIDFSVAYDDAADVLYLSRGVPVLSSVKEEDGLLWRYSSADDRLVALTVLDFAAGWKLRLRELADRIAHAFGISQAEADALLRDVALAA